MRIRFGIAAAILSFILGTGAEAQFIGGFDIDGCWPDSMSFEELEVGVAPCHSPPSLTNMGITKLFGQTAIGSTACIYPDNDISLLRVEWNRWSVCAASDSIHRAIDASSETKFRNTDDAGAKFNSFFADVTNPDDEDIDSVFVVDVAIIEVNEAAVLNGSAAGRFRVDGESDEGTVDTMYGVYAWADTVDDGSAGVKGVVGQVAGTSYGVYGSALQTGQLNYGVYGNTESTSGYGVYSADAMTSSEQHFKRCKPLVTSGAASVLMTVAGSWCARNTGTSSCYVGFDNVPEIRDGVRCHIDTAMLVVYTEAAADHFDILRLLQSLPGCDNGETIGGDDGYGEGVSGCDSIAIATDFDLDGQFFVYWDPDNSSDAGDTRIYWLYLWYRYITPEDAP